MVETHDANMHHAHSALPRWIDAAKLSKDYVQPVDISPPETKDAEGWFVQNGMEFSNARSYGCVRIRPQYETGLLYRDYADDVAQQYNASRRLIYLMGVEIIQRQWNMLPTHDVSQLDAGHHAEAYIPLEPPVPFNQDEQDVWFANYVHWHMSAASIVTTGNFLSNAVVVDNAFIKGHRVWTVTNHPNWIMRDVLERFSGRAWIRKQYHATLTRVRRMDRDEIPKVEGYSRPMDGEISPQWYRDNEPSDQYSIPTLRAWVSQAE